MIDPGGGVSASPPFSSQEVRLRLLDHNPKTVVLLGMGPSLTSYLEDTLTQELGTDFCDEIWAINMAANCMWHDVGFWMDDLKDQHSKWPHLFDLIRKRARPVITSVAYPEVYDKSYGFPFKETAPIGVAAFGRPYMNNGVAMAIAYAMWKGVEKMKLYGCDFTYPNRVFAEEGRACVEAWLTLASERGMKIEIAKSTSLFDAETNRGVYGYAKQPVWIGPDGEPRCYAKPGETPPDLTV